MYRIGTIRYSTRTVLYQPWTEDMMIDDIKNDNIEKIDNIDEFVVTEN